MTHLTTALEAITTASHWVNRAGDEREEHYLELREMIEDVRRAMLEEIEKEESE